MFASGIDDEGKTYHAWPMQRFREIFVTENGFREDQDVKAIIYSMGGPFPSNIEGFEFKMNVLAAEVRVYYVCRNREIR